MPRKRKYSRRRKYLRGNVDEGIGLSTLGATTLISAIFDETVNERTKVSSVVATYALQDMPTASADGPIVVGLAHSDYTDAEIEEVLENTGSWNEGSKVEQEIAKRLVRIVGQFQDSGAPGIEVLNDGKPIKTKLNWIVNQGQTLKLWAYNAGSSALTGSAVVRAQGHANLWPL